MIGALQAIALIPIVAVSGIFIALLFRGIDRILAARMQARIGPPLSQPFIDIKKLFMKESIVPKNAVKWLFSLMPIVALTASLAVLLYIPLFGFKPLLDGYGDAILVIYLFAASSLAMVLGGFASSSRYAAIGAQREMVAMLSYEFPLAISIIAIAWLLSKTSACISAFSLGAISAIPIWGLVGPLGFLGLVLLFLVMLFVMPGEAGTIPFDAPEAETEIAGGVLAEYSGRNLALFYISSSVKTIAFAALIVALFMPWNVSGTLSLAGAEAIAADALFFLAKLFIVAFVASTFMRIAIARLRITQIVKVYWGYASLAALFGFLLIAIDLILAV